MHRIPRELATKELRANREVPECAPRSSRLRTRVELTSKRHRQRRGKPLSVILATSRSGSEEGGKGGGGWGMGRYRRVGWITKTREGGLIETRRRRDVGRKRRGSPCEGMPIRNVASGTRCCAHRGSATLRRAVPSRTSGSPLAQTAPWLRQAEVRNLGSTQVGVSGTHPFGGGPAAAEKTQVPSRFVCPLPRGTQAPASSRGPMPDAAATGPRAPGYLAASILTRGSLAADAASKGARRGYRVACYAPQPRRSGSARGPASQGRSSRAQRASGERQTRM